ncbi:MAG: DUF2231 domain-containing protein [Propionicimonas sp.]|nr:DUF2231 domain-containing protein [Propionicimonas sp.]
MDLTQFPPLHPLVVHGAVVLLPLAALGAIVIALSSRARKRYGSLVAVLSVVALGAVIGARLSGEQLAGTTQAQGTLGTHMAWGLIAPWPATLLAVASVGLVLVSRGTSRPLLLTFCVLSILAAVVSVLTVVVAGHLGATAVWVG